MFGRIVLMTCCLAQIPPMKGFAQGVKALERIGRDRPLLVPTTVGPRAWVNELEFVEHEGRTWLLAAASDKVVHRWEVADSGELTLHSPLRWPLFRGLRGAIYTMANVGGGRVAVAGVGVKTSQVTLVSVDESEPPIRLADELTGARQNVWSLSADPGNDRLYVGEAARPDGRALLLSWSLGANPSVARCRTDLSSVKRVAVSPDGEHVVACGPAIDRQSWGIRVYRTTDLLADRNGIQDVRPVQSSKLASRWDTTVNALDWVSDRTWIAGTVFDYATGTVGGNVSLPGFGSEVLTRDSEFLEIPGRSGRITVSNPSPREVRFRDATTNKFFTIGSGETQTFDPTANLSRIYANGRQPLGPFAPARFSGKTIAIPTYVRDLAYCPANRRLASFVECDSRHHLVVDVRTANGGLSSRVPFTGGTEWTESTALAFSRDGRFVAGAGADMFVGDDDKQVCAFAIRVWSGATGKQLAQHPDAAGGSLSVGGPIKEIVTAKSGKRDTIIYRYGVPTRVARDYFRIYPSIVDGQEDCTEAEANAAFDVKAGHTYQFSTNPKFPRRNGTIDVLTGAFTAGTGGTGLPVVESYFAKGGQDFGPIYTMPENNPTCAIVFQTENRWYLAIGQADGLQVWDLDHCNRKLGYRALARAFYGHDAQVTSIDVSSDRSQLYSGSSDGTLCGWSLKGLDRTRELGLTLAPGTARVTAVADDTAGWYAGFQPGTTVTGLFVGGHTIPANRIPDRLRDPLPGLEYLITAQNAQGKQLNLQTPVAHDPLWTYYARHDRQCIMWTPEGYYETSEFNGTDSIEWVLNLGGPLGQSDEVVVMSGLDQEGSGLRDKDVLESVATTGTRPTNTIPPPPSITLEQRGDSWAIEAAPVGNSQVTHSEILLNGRVIATGDGQPLLVTPRQINDLVRTGTNTVAGIVETTRDDRTIRFRRVATFRSAGGGTPQPRLNFLGIAVDKAPGMPALPTVVNDLDRISKAIRKNRTSLAGKRHPKLDLRNAATGEHIVLAKDIGNDPPTAANITGAFTTLAGKVAPDDLTIIVLSSHGELAPVPGGRGTEYVFHASDETIRQAELSRMIQQLPCRTLLILDTCHAGGGAEDQKHISQFAQVVNGPMMLTACRRDEEAFFEDFEFKHGFFLASVCEALEGEKINTAAPALNYSPDDNGDGFVSVAELAKFVQRRTPELKEEFTTDSATQTPQILPSVFFPDSKQSPVR